MNLLTCNLLKPSFASGFPTQNVSQKMQFHHAATPSLHNFGQTKKHFGNPNIFYQKPLEKNIPSSYKQSDLYKETNSQLNSSDMIPEKTKRNSDSLLIEAVKNICAKENTPKMEASVSCTTKKIGLQPMVNESELSESDDSFIVFENEEKGANDQELCREEFVEDDSSVEDDDESEDSFIDYNNHKRQRQPSFAESEDSFIVFEGKDGGETDDEDIEDDDEEEGTEDEEGERRAFKSDNGKKVTFAEEPELCTVHLMIKWSFAYRKARKGLWEQFARDNERFKFRANQFGAILNKFLQPEHRLKVYEERFKDRQD